MQEQQQSQIPSVSEVKEVLADEIIKDLLKERKREHTWKWVKRIGFSLTGLIFFVIYLAFYVTQLGYKVTPNSDIVGVVQIQGPIVAEGRASAEKLVPVLEKVFKADNVKAVVLNIDSPGGQPAESERINAMLDYYKKETKKPVYAVISNTGASAAYMIAIHADKVIAGEYSVVGSIGAMMMGWDYHKVLDKFDLSYRVFKSGELKDTLSPYKPMTPEMNTKVQSLVSAMGTTFADEVKKYRGDKLAKDVNLFTGEVWPGLEAVKLGLVDEIGTLDHVVKTTWGLKTFDFGPEAKRSGGFPFSLESFQEVLSESIKGAFRSFAEESTYRIQ